MPGAIFTIVIPAKAGIHGPAARAAEEWVPAFARTTSWEPAASA